MNDAFSSFTKSLRPLSQSLEKGFVQLQQVKLLTQGALETFNAADVTELPQEYKLLEKKLDSVKLMYEQLSKVSRNYTLAAYDYEPDMTDRASDLVSQVGVGASSIAERFISTVQQRKAADVGNAAVETPSSLSHAFAKAALTSATDLDSPQEPLCLLL